MDVVFAKCVPLLLLVIFLSGGTLGFCYANKSSGSILCIESEKQALMSIKQGIVYDADNFLASWGAGKEDCCKWAGIVCDNITGHVKELQLGNPRDYYMSFTLSGKLSPSLLNLTLLSRLELMSFDAEGAQIPEFIGSLVGLRYLDLSDATFGGMIPQQLGNLSSLQHLSLGGYYWLVGSSKLYSENLQWLSGLSSLEHLDMRYVNLSKASDHWLLAINKLPSLLELHLSSCELRHIHRLFYVNFTSLEILDISENSFNSLLPDWIFRLSNLVDLTLSNNKFIGPFPQGSWSLKFLTLLDVSRNSLNSTIPGYLYGFANLKYLYLDQNNFHGIISSAIGNLTSLVALELLDNSLEGNLQKSIGNLCNLEVLDLAENKLDGKVTEVLDSWSIGCLSNKLRFLTLHSNCFSGPIPVSLGNLSALQDLSIYKNQLNGPLPETLASLYNLRGLDISDNHLEGVVSEVHLANLTNLYDFSADRNSLTLRVSPEWIPPFNLGSLNLASWNLGSQFPTWLRSQKSLDSIDLSNTGISGSIPSWFWNQSEGIHFINFCNNQLYGELPAVLPINTYSGIYLCSNKFNGTIPRNLFMALDLNLSNNSLSGDISEAICHPKVDNYLHYEGDPLTWVLDLGGNLLSGNIPDCWMKWPSLEVIDLGNNNLIGEIPSSMGSLQKLRSLHLRNNSLSGEIPSFLQSCTLLTTLDLSLNIFVGTIPTWLGVNLSNLMVLGVRSNKLDGKIPLELCHLTMLQILDASDNNLSGTIPSCFKNFSAMATKNHSSQPISYVYSSMDLFIESTLVLMKGREDKYDKILPLVTSLDLSSNNLSGEIPEQLTSLQGLVSLNLSRNHLRGRIPDKIGDMGSILSLDISRNQLSGNIPPSMSNLNFLSYLNLSWNNLSGEIPLSTQLQSFDPSSFIGNQLCGPPLLKKCRDDPKYEGQEEGDGDGEEYWFRLGMAVGFVVGFLGVISPLVFYGYYRRVYFWFLEEYLWYKILDCFNKFKRLGR